MVKKSTTRLLPGGLLAAAIACALPGAAALAATTTASSVAGWVAHATKIGAASGDLKTTITLHMALQNQAGLKTFVDEVSSPKSPQYGRYLTTDAFAQRFAPAAADVNAAKAFLENAGLSNVTVGPHGVYVSATATVAQLRAAFGVNQDLYSYHGLTLRANNNEPTLPNSLAGKAVYLEGLDDTGLLRTPMHRSATQGDLVAPASAKAVTGASTVTPPPVADSNPSPYCNTSYGPNALVAKLSTAADVYGAAIPWLNCGYTPHQIQEAYGLTSVGKFDGTGITVAIVDAYASPTLLADANRYAGNHGLKPLVSGTNFSEIIPLGIYSVNPDAPCGPYGWWEEQSLDISAVHGAAPGANIVYVGSTDCATSLDQALYNTLYNHVADVVTNSWSQNGEALAPGQQSATDQALAAGGAMGITVLFSSGDDGDLASINGVASGAYPSTSAYATGVGGTTLLFESANGAKAEYGWGDYRDYLADVTVNSATSVTDSGVELITNDYGTFDNFSFYSGSGGGISLLSAQPSYQAGVVPAALATTLNLASGYAETLPNAQRVSPDVAMVADPYTGYLFGETFTIAGNAIADHGCKPISKTEEYCENAIGGTSLASPLMAGVIAIMNQKRLADGKSMVGFANPLLYSLGSGGNGKTFETAPLNQIVSPTEPVSVLRGYADNLSLARVVAISSVPSLITETAPYAFEECGLQICYGIDDQWNFTSLSAWGGTPAGYNDVTGLGVPYVPLLLQH